MQATMAAMSSYNRVFIFIVTIVLLISDGESLTCLSCDKVTSLEDESCQKFVDCGKDEACYVEQYLDQRTLGIRYKAGCRSLKDCKLVSCAVEFYGEEEGLKRTRRDYTTCTQCCYNDTCNIKGCGSDLLASTGGSLHCFKCQHTSTNETCKEMTQCQADESCGARLSKVGIEYQYEFGCFPTRLCEFLASHTTNRASQCCQDHLCNLNPQLKKQDPESIVNDLECPAELVKTTTVKTSTIVPTTPSITSTLAPTTMSSTTTPTPTSTTTPQSTSTTIPTTTHTSTSVTTQSVTASTTSSTTTPASSTATVSPITTPTTSSTTTQTSTSNTILLSTQTISTKSGVSLAPDTPTPSTVASQPSSSLTFTLSTTVKPTVTTSATPTPTTPTVTTATTPTVTTQTLSMPTKSTVMTSTTPTVMTATTPSVTTSTKPTVTTSTTPTVTTSTTPTVTTSTPPTVASSTISTETTSTTPTVTTSTTPTVTTSTTPTVTTSTTPTVTTSTKPTVKTSTKTTFTTASLINVTSGTTRKSDPGPNGDTEIYCQVCQDDPTICEIANAPQLCKAPNNYCMNKITNHIDGSRETEMYCGRFEDCYQEWWIGSSDSQKCEAFTEEFVFTFDFECTYCCTSNLCNARLHPETDLYGS